ncbi:NAD-dependent succinate-semialdehyde dehydrogenase [Granulicella sibirica]|uniref:Succinate-semialdehyde dehydrogenase [NAD] n=1 Tax=Granulicella sibirica TaxID=2479048 RepID=A0A4Q0SVB2_9BACT|nr:NAD-dependent succinate-semialdehyde dehydrogenase [Granulicella sibirica]RXH55005.1 Succinate-semialdehyde dehydrogenase [NAD] [Granulicella sibirica]
MAIESINPATGALIRSFPALTDEAIQQRLALAAEAFAAYRRVPLAHRTLCMRKLAAILDQEVDDLAALITTEMGKPIKAARAEIAKCAAVCRYYADHAALMLAPEVIATPQNHSYVRWEPLGPVLAVMPWNFPFWQVFRFLAPALMAGNVGVLKHAPNVPQCALAIESLVRRAGFPRGTLQAMLVEVPQVEGILSDKRIVAVTVTGSPQAGKAVGALASWLIKKSVLELGGSDPFVVMGSADIKLAAETAVQARCINSGQSCIAAKRFIVVDEVYEEFTARFVDGMESIRVGDPMQEATDLGPLATAGILAGVESQVKAAVDAGARLLTGGAKMLGKGNYFEPTVLADVPRTASVFREEIFGPVAMLFRVKNMDEAIALANDTPFGLGASVWTREAMEQQRLIAELECGMVYVNSMVVSDPALPFGGIKRSGYGRELSAAGMREFLNAKTVVISESSLDIPEADTSVVPYEPFKPEDFDDADF